MTVNCPRCKKDKNEDVEMDIMVSMHVLAPSSMESQFSKKNMRKKEFRVMGVSGHEDCEIF